MSTVKNQRRVATPMCKVCIDAGKSEKIFTSHFTKNRDGKVCCPTLLSQKCRRCDKSGHTVKYCVVTSPSLTPSSTPPSKHSSITTPPPAPKKKVGFAVLDESDEEDDNKAYFKKDKKVEEYPSLSKIKIVSKSSENMRTWATVAETPKIETKMEAKIESNVEPMSKPPTFHKTRIFESWADCVDTDSDDEYDNYY